MGKLTFGIVGIRFLLVILVILGNSIPIFSQDSQTILSGELVNCQIDSLRLFELDGSVLKVKQSVPLNFRDGTYAFNMPVHDIPLGFYLIGDGKRENSKFIILGENQEIKLTGNCNALSSAQIWNSKLNPLLKKYSNTSDSLQREHSKLLQQFRMILSKNGDQTSLISNLAKNDSVKLSLLQKARQESPLLGGFIALKTYLSYQNHANKEISEAEYFAKNYFKQANLSDPIYNRIPYIIDAFKQYAFTLTQIFSETEKQKNYLSHELQRLPQASPAYKAALTGILLALKDKNVDGFMHFSKIYLDDYQNTDPLFSSNLIKQRASLQSRVQGALAPEISLPTPEGDTLHLSELRGKVVLIDFWASWCGPCRRENPLVKRIYEKYKPLGFEILGVSLDRSKDAWLKAIETDALEWKHVSDLKFWQSTAAQTYGVHAIPYTVLLDSNGKIVATKLRGQALENKLAEIFSSDNEESFSAEEGGD